MSVQNVLTSLFWMVGQSLWKYVQPIYKLSPKSTDDCHCYFKYEVQLLFFLHSR